MGVIFVDFPQEIVLPETVKMDPIDHSEKQSVLVCGTG